MLAVKLNDGALQPVNTILSCKVDRSRDYRRYHVCIDLELSSGSDVSLICERLIGYPDILIKEEANALVEIIEFAIANPYGTLEQFELKEFHIEILNEYIFVVEPYESLQNAGGGGGI